MMAFDPVTGQRTRQRRSWGVIMALVLPPSVRWMILCDDVLKDSRWPGKPVIVGLISVIRWPGGTGPLLLPKLTVYLVLTDGRGKGRGRIVCREEATGQEVFR